MPRRWQAKWATAERDDVAADAERALGIDRLGNLTLVSGGLNSSLSNSTWEVKSDALAQNSLLLMNKQLASKPVWNESQIDERGLDLAHRICELWPGPDSPNWLVEPAQ